MILNPQPPVVTTGALPSLRRVGVSEGIRMRVNPMFFQPPKEHC